MDYSVSTIDGGLTGGMTCERCGHQQHRVYGDIHFAYLFLESLPWFPTAKKVRVECDHCYHIADSDNVTKWVDAAIIKRIFSFSHMWHKYLGIVVFMCLLAGIIHQANQQDERIKHYLAQPEINDFYHLDFRQFSNKLGPYQKYKLAKVVDVTGDMVSVVFGNFLYRYQSNAVDAVRIGHVRNSGYFEAAKRHFSVAELQDLYQQGAIYKVGRPEGNMLYGSYIFSQSRQFRSKTYMPGKRQHQQGIAFIKANYIEGHYQTALEFLTTSAQMGYVEGQISLAELYLSGNVGEVAKDKALFWLEQAAIQSSQRAVDKYRAVCQGTPSCDISAFYKRLNEAGVVFSVNL